MLASCSKFLSLQHSLHNLAHTIRPLARGVSESAFLSTPRLPWSSVRMTKLIKILCTSFCFIINMYHKGFFLTSPFCFDKCRTIFSLLVRPRLAGAGVLHLWPFLPNILDTFFSGVGTAQYLWLSSLLVGDCSSTLPSSEPSSKISSPQSLLVSFTHLLPLFLIYFFIKGDHNLYNRWSHVTKKGNYIKLPQTSHLGFDLPNLAFLYFCYPIFSPKYR